MVAVGQMRIAFADERFARHFKKCVEDRLLGDSAAAQMAVDHRLALGGKVGHCGCAHGPPPDRRQNPRAKEPVPPMTATDTVFAGSIPAIYDRYMVPLLFRPYAEEVARRARAFMPGHVL